VSSDRAAGNIGLPVFKRFRLVTDYPHEDRSCLSRFTPVALGERSGRNGGHTESYRWIDPEAHAGRLFLRLLLSLIASRHWNPRRTIKGWRKRTVTLYDGFRFDAVFTIRRVRKSKPRPSG
jgi:hypothetical protein